MKSRRFLTALCVVGLIGIFVFGITSMVYARTGVDVEEAKGGAAAVEGQMPATGAVNPEAKGPDKGSPMHAWKAIVAAGKKTGDTITTAEFSGMRNWSDRTRGYELQSLVGIGVLAKGDKRSEYKLLVTATAEQIDQVNVQTIGVLNRQGRDGLPLGIDSYRLDEKYLGAGKPADIAKIVRDVTGSTATPEQVPKDFVQAGIDAGIVFVSVAYHGDTEFMINKGHKNLADAAGIANAAEGQALLAALVDTCIVTSESWNIEGNVAGFGANDVTTKTVMYKEEFVTATPEAFKTAFEALPKDVTAVIVAITMNNGEIEAVLKKVGLSNLLGGRIVIMGVKEDSAAALAFKDFFGNNPFVNLQNRGIDSILGDEKLVTGLKGAV